MDKKGRFDIPGRVMEQVDRCNRDKACLTDQSYPLCEVKYSSADPRFAFIACRSLGHECNYRIYSNSTHLCTCPARTFIYKRYER